jgi:cell wall-associated NlpC family hydrolase
MPVVTACSGRLLSPICSLTTARLRRIIECMIQALMKGFVAGLIVAATQAAASPASPESVSTIDSLPSSSQPTMEAPALQAARLQNLLIYAISLIGVKYKFGGNTAQSGFDCSGFVRYVFAETLALDLPRDSYAMGKLGTSINSDALQPGDLLFYNTRQRAFSHVGIYLGEDRFVHAPSRGKSVEIVDMSDRYWKKRFNGARRVVTE